MEYYRNRISKLRLTSLVCGFIAIHDYQVIQSCWKAYWVAWSIHSSRGRWMMLVDVYRGFYTTVYNSSTLRHQWIGLQWVLCLALVISFISSDASFQVFKELCHTTVGIFFYHASHILSQFWSAHLQEIKISIGYGTSTLNCSQYVIVRRFVARSGQLRQSSQLFNRVALNVQKNAATLECLWVFVWSLYGRTL